MAMSSTVGDKQHRDWSNGENIEMDIGRKEEKEEKRPFAGRTVVIKRWEEATQRGDAPSKTCPLSRDTKTGSKTTRRSVYSTRCTEKVQPKKKERKEIPGKIATLAPRIWNNATPGLYEQPAVIGQRVRE